MFAETQVERTERRYTEREGERERVASVLSTSGVVAANPRDRVERRKRRVADAPSTPREVAGVVEEPVVEISDVALERVIDADDLLDINYIELARRAARAVGRIRIRTTSGRAAGYGTGFLVSPNLLLTNHHVFGDARTARSSLVDFGYENDVTGQPLSPMTFGFEPDRFFVTDDELDFSLVAVRQSSESGTPLRAFGWCPLIEAQGKVLLGEPVNVIQHPSGDRKRLALRQNDVIDVLDLFIQYHTDTNPGSSGSPVFNDQWEVVALHHSGVPRRDNKRRILARGGALWRADMGDEAIDWIANEGVRVSRIVGRVKTARLAAAAAELRDELLAGVEPAPESVVSRPNGAAVVLSDQGDVRVSAEGLTVDVSVRVSPIATGTPSVRRIPGVPTTVVAPTVVDDAELAAALAEAGAASSRPYYEAATDASRREAYWNQLTLIDDPIQNFTRLSQFLETTHADRPAYRPAVQLYPWVDLQPNRRLRSIYSQREYDPEAVIREDFATEQYLEGLKESLASRSDMAPETAEALLEAAAPFNCEHVVPQSWFGKREPMRGDLHHLFTCEWGCNSFRGNTPYFDFADFEEKDRGECGRRLDTRFEPTGGKGEVARATLYFLVRYPGEIGQSTTELTAERLPMLLAWHEAFAVSAHERHRNLAIHEKQGNRNPFIDNPDWTDRVDFSLGFSAP